MATSKLNSSLVLGQVTTERLTAVHIPAALRPSVDAFDALYAALKIADAKAQSAFVAHASEVTRTKHAHDELRASVETQVARRDGLVLRLRSRLAELRASDRPRYGEGPAVPMTLDVLSH